ncbi:uncharacterized protein E6C27_scaffold316G001250 [Cucumis melo var. makuwa]|uniref:Transposase n=1 Tax=Cucumis melo var. makuwa TaxID=1194695 RepID=A0A5A7TT93_CUCMM|nr:uncharacterized protein E6C27_scaffold316G001250 [Cucumis melo var. makuwa]
MLRLLPGRSPTRRTPLPCSLNAAPLLAPLLVQRRTTISIMNMTKLSVGFCFQFVVDDELPNSSFYGESSKFDTHTCEENDGGSVKEMIEVAHEEYSKDPNGFEKLLVNAEKPLKEFANETECPECGQSRWKNVKDRNEKRKKIPSKVICERIEDGKLLHPTDSPAWKLVDFKWPDFGYEHRNLRLALSADGVNPHGPKQPGDDVGTYLAPLIEDLKLLWENGVQCYDAYREEVFNLRSVLLWTINDFPAYGTLLDIPGKSKDGLNARRDLVDLKLRSELTPISSEKKISIPLVCYTLTNEEK